MDLGSETERRSREAPPARRIGTPRQPPRRPAPGDSGHLREDRALRLFQSIFGRGEAVGRYPETLIDQAIERAVDGTDPRIRVLRGYQKRLRAPVIHAIDEVVSLGDAIPDPLTAGVEGYRNDFRLAALFASADEMLRIFGHDKALSQYLSSRDGRGAGQVSTLLLARLEQKNVLGMDLVGDQVRRDVAQVSVSFSGHHLLEPRASDEELKRYLKRRAFDHLLALALDQITQVRMDRADLARQRELLQRQLRTMKRGALTFDEGPEAGSSDESSLQAELDDVSGQLQALGADEDVLKTHLEIVAERLEQAERQLWLDEISLHLGPLNIQCDPDNPSARLIVLKELRNARGARAVALPVRIAPRDLPPRPDFLTEAQRYL
jgi:hypothetical protein